MWGVGGAAGGLIPAQEIVSCGFFALGAKPRPAHDFSYPTGETTMKRWVIAGAGALVWMAAASPSGAADIPAAAPIAKAPARVAFEQRWYGFYIGVHGGYGWGRNAIQATPDAFYAPFFVAAGAPTSFAGNPKGF